jgi:hypothetical protein
MGLVPYHGGRNATGDGGLQAQLAQIRKSNTHGRIVIEDRFRYDGAVTKPVPYR